MVGRLNVPYAQEHATPHVEPRPGVYLVSLPGIGPKSALCVTLDRLRAPAVSIALLDGQPEWYIALVTFTIEIEREDDGRWLAEVPALPGVLAYGQDPDESVARVQALALRVIAERLEHRETPAEFLNVSFQAA